MGDVYAFAARAYGTSGCRSWFYGIVLVSRLASGGVTRGRRSGSQILEDKPAGAVDLLETTLLVKKTEFDPKTTNATLPVSQNPKDAAKAVAVTKLYTCVYTRPDQLHTCV